MRRRTKDERLKLFQSAKQIEDAGFDGNQEALWSQAQIVLPDDRRRSKFYSSLLSHTNKEYQYWKKTGEVKKDGRASPVIPGKRPYPKKLPLQPAPASIVPPFNFCPVCGCNLRTIKFE
jgi:hypothetical protein